jgi:hypothetical protein
MIVYLFCTPFPKADYKRSLRNAMHLMVMMLQYVLMTVSKLKRKTLPKAVQKMEDSSNVASGNLFVPSGKNPYKISFYNEILTLYF